MDQDKILDESQDEQLTSEIETKVSDNDLDETIETKEVLPSDHEDETKDETKVETKTDETPKEPVYQPNYKFTAYGEEKEFEDFAKPLVNKDNEEKFKELFSKAYAFEKMQTKKESLESKIKELEPEYNKLNKGIEVIRTLKEHGDYENLFKVLGMEDKEIANYIIQRHKYQSMTPDERQTYDRQIDARMENIQLKNVLAEQQYMNQMSIVQDHVSKLDQELSNPEIHDFVGRYDSLNGQGAFKQFVWDVGRSHFVNTGGDLKTGMGGESLTPQQAIQTALKRALYQPTPRQQTVQNSTSTEQPKTVNKVPNVLPNLGKGSQAPGKSGVGSVADLHNLRKQMEAAEETY